MDVRHHGGVSASALVSQMHHASAPPADEKGTAVDSINANIESMTNRVETLTRFAARVVDGLIGGTPKSDSPTVRPVPLSTQGHLHALELALEQLASEINRLG